MAHPVRLHQGLVACAAKECLRIRIVGVGSLASSRCAAARLYGRLTAVGAMDASLPGDVGCGNCEGWDGMRAQRNQRPRPRAINLAPNGA